jgi:DNA-binding transcriptional LysR family regulator
MAEKHMRYTLLTAVSTEVCLHNNSKWADIAEFSDGSLRGIPQISFYNDIAIKEESGRKQIDRFDINSLSTMNAIVNEKKGVCLITNREYQKFFRKNRNLILRPIQPPVTFHYGYIVRADCLPSPQQKAFVAALHRSLQLPLPDGQK